MYIAPELRQHVSPEAVASCLYDACTMYKTHGVPEPVKVAVGTPDGLVTILVTFGDADSSRRRYRATGAGLAKDLSDYANRLVLRSAPRCSRVWASPHVSRLRRALLTL